MTEVYLTNLRWTWYWRTNDEGNEAECGIMAETRPGHAYAVVRCPRYMSEGQWTELATHICDTHNVLLYPDPASRWEGWPEAPAR